MSRTNRIIARSCFTLCLWSGFTVASDELTVAVATNFLTTAEELINKFEEESDLQITVVAGSSGQLFAQAKMAHLMMFSFPQTKKKSKRLLTKI